MQRRIKFPPRLPCCILSCRRLAWLSATGLGYAIQYPAIALHAVCKDLETFPEACIFCQLTSSERMDDDADEEEDNGMDSAIPAEAAAAPADISVAATAAEHGAGQRRRGEDGSAKVVLSGPNLARASEIRLVPDMGAAERSGDSSAAAGVSGAAASLDATLESMFSAMSACAELHPDLGMDGDDDEDGEMMGGGFGGLLRFAPGTAAGSAAAASGEAGSAAVPFGEGGWYGDASVLASLGLPMASDGSISFAGGDGAADGMDDDARAPAP